PYLLLGLLLLTAIIFAQEASRFSELIVVASRNGMPMRTLWRVMAALVPGILVFTLPISLLVGTLVGLGRLSGDSEIVALGASGTSRLRILRPVVALSLVVAALLFYITFSALPLSMRNLTDLKANRSLIFQGLNAEIKPRVFEESIPQKVIYIEEIDRASDLWRNIFLVDLSDPQGDMKIMTASSGSLRQGERSEMPELHLEHGAVHQTNSNQPPDEESAQQREAKQDSPPAISTPPPSANGSPGSDKKEKKRSTRSYTAGRFDEMWIGLEVNEDKRTEASGIDLEARPVEEMPWSELISYAPPPGGEGSWRAEIHKRIALPTASLVFALLGVAFGISNVRIGRSLGLLLGLAITIIYYLLALWGEHAQSAGRVPAWFGIWLANIVLAAFGVIVLWSQRRPGSDALSALTVIRHAWPFRRRDAEQEGARTGAGDQQLTSRHDPGVARRTFHLPQLLDRLVLSDLVRFFVYILGGFSTLILIITVFQLLDYIARNNIEWLVVANYLAFLIPTIVNSVAPLAALVAVMVTFAILQKTSQVVALKASGQSIYRMAVPALVGSILLSAVVFLNQDYIMPFTHRRQNNLRYLIRKGQEPPQTFYQTSNQWICGTDSRIFNYAYFDPTSNVFARLSVIDLSKEPYGIKRRFYARRAWWDGGQKEWVLENGWESRFEDQKPSLYETFKERRVSLVEHPDYFKKELVGSQSLTLNELRRKISDLSRSGFDVVELKIALQRKIAFPLTCLVMVIVGLPFSFSAGKKGALYGIAIGIGIGLTFWGLLGLFAEMGRYEVLPPLLAAWGPNMLFGAGGVYLFLTSRT
ncbi:MAG TPA: LptF/LptG family permease, partial [Blastocatellia bacterium]|nr:LptF/LptG family permease [Blastocatellia bacterium]